MPADCTAAPDHIVGVNEMVAPPVGWPEAVAIQGKSGWTDRAAFAEAMRAKQKAQRVPNPKVSYAPLRAAIEAARASELLRDEPDIAHCIADEFWDENEAELSEAWLDDARRHEAVVSEILAVPAPTAAGEPGDLDVEGLAATSFEPWEIDENDFTAAIFVSMAERKAVMVPIAASILQKAKPELVKMAMALAGDGDGTVAMTVATDLFETQKWARALADLLECAASRLTAALAVTVTDAAPTEAA